MTFAAGSSTDAEDEYLYWFDPETARLEQFAYSFQGRPGGLRFRRLDNYRRVGGILCAAALHEQVATVDRQPDEREQAEEARYALRDD